MPTKKKPATRRKPKTLRGRQLLIRLSDREQAQLETLASANALTVSEWVRQQAIVLPWSRMPGTEPAKS